MTYKVSDKLLKRFERLAQDIENFRVETGMDQAPLYEDANTSRDVKDFKLFKNGKLVWIEDGKKADYIHDYDEDVEDTIKFWRACLKRGKRYWSMDTEILDKIQEGEMEDIQDED